MRKFPLNLKNRVCPEIFHRIEYTFHHLNFWVTCACPEKKRMPWNFSLDWIHFFHSGFLSKFSIGQKNSVCPEFFTVLNILFTFLVFEQLSLHLTNRVCPDFSLYWISFLHSGVMSNFALALKNRVCPEFFHSIKYIFYIQDFWATCAWPEKQSVTWNFSLYGI